jgi:ABC-type xylose transport system permease subunit
VIVTAFRINALIATLAMSFVVSGLASLVTAGNLVIDYSHPGFADLARSSFLTVNTSTWTMLAVVVALAVVLSRPRRAATNMAASAPAVRPVVKAAGREPVGRDGSAVRCMAQDRDGGAAGRARYDPDQSA